MSGVRLAPEHVALEARRPSVSDHSEGVAVVADAQEGQVTHLALPQGLLLFLENTRTIIIIIIIIIVIIIIVIIVIIVIIIFYN